MRTHITIIFVIVFFLEVKAQHFTHDIGVFVGSTSLQTDYGQRENFGSNFRNNGMAISVAHYLHFFNKTLRWDPNNGMYNHIMVKTELQFLGKNKLEHHGIYAASQSYSGEQLRAMKGTARMINFGVNMEYYLRPLEEFFYPYSEMVLNPFFTFGIKYSFYTNSLKSDLGDWKEDRSVLPQKYTLENSLAIGSGQAFSLNLGIGTRIKITKKLDISASYSYEYFFSDKIDGLQASVVENKSNEWLINMQLGLVYHLNFNTPLFY
ncbi:hypothetical protein BTO04_07740 [Polaribacter sp. SA4-10]|uniref:THC0290_0291 family protein n=1 Tax=Polaribacter sp. SA4-10 TaxID=754397 RepID=UPI000B3C14DC|nr:hypothetical protein [Polaribacter sp. SA4-10]ARV06598.1 hypothetical protein BTO04_07740 [Polaribacter sp. SA4-10]